MADGKPLKVKLIRKLCIPGIKEDDIQALVEALGVVQTKEGILESVVTSTGGVEVKFVFGTDGNFAGLFAKINGKQIAIIDGINSTELHTFKGPPSATNPGQGWTVEIDLTKKYLSQTGAQSTWELFYASRTGILNIDA